MRIHIDGTVANDKLSRRDAIIVGGSIAFPLLVLPQTQAQSVDETSPIGSRTGIGESEDDPVDAIRPDIVSKNWDPICTLGHTNRLLESISLIPVSAEKAIGQDPKQFPGTRFPRLHQVRCEETNPNLMEFVTYHLRDFPLCYARARGWRGGWGGSGMRLLLLRMRTRVDTFWISVTRKGFARGEGGADFQSVFFSSILAHSFNLIYRNATGESVPKLIMDALTGELHVQEERERFEKWELSQKTKKD